MKLKTTHLATDRVSQPDSCLTSTRAITHHCVPTRFKTHSWGTGCLYLSRTEMKALCGSEEVFFEMVI